MNSTFALCSLSILFSVEPASKDEDATRAGVLEVIDRLWDLPQSQVTKSGSSLLTRLRRKDADQSEIQYAYGVVLAHHGLWDAAETNFSAVSQKHKTSPVPLFALAHVHAFHRKPARAMDDIVKALSIEPRTAESLMIGGEVLTFLQRKPPAKFRADEAKKAEAAIFVSLNDDEQAIYREGSKRAADYIEQLPELRIKLMAPLQELQASLDKARKVASDTQKKVANAQADFAKKDAEVRQVESSAIADSARLVRTAERARARGDLVQAQAAEVERASILQAAQARVQALQVDLQRLQTTITELSGQLKLEIEEAEQLERTLATGQKAVEARLESPPPFWDPHEERRRLLENGRFDVSEPTEPDPSKPSKVWTDEERAKSLLQVADEFRASGRDELANEYLRRVVKEYPKTLAAKDAADRLKRSDNPVDRPRPKRK